MAHSWFEIPKKYPNDPGITIAVREDLPNGWHGEVWVSGRRVIDTNFARTGSDMSPAYAASVLALFLEQDPECDELREETERLGDWGHEVQHYPDGTPRPSFDD